ncbi:MAG: methyltransferase domain-containing protein [Deltaproteobacteria bacterium]|nr:methyltransferase domain-containing protein [Deltaproteobacteria bacterium]
MFDNLCNARDKGINPIKCDLSKGLPYRNQTFDCILAGEIIEHIVDTDYFLEEINRLLINKGVLIITTPNLVNLENRFRILIGRYPIFVDYTSRGDNHVRVYTGRALIKQLREGGFLIEKYTGSFVPFISYSLFKKMTSRLMPILSIMGLLFPSLAIHAIIKARKK